MLMHFWRKNILSVILYSNSMSFKPNLGRKKGMPISMSARINYVDRNRSRRMAVPAQNAGEECTLVTTCDTGICGGDGCGCNNSPTGCGCAKSVDFCETVTLHESFNAGNVCTQSTRIAYDTSFLGYTVEQLTMDASLPCGCSCPVDVYRISLTGAIPYIVNVGQVESGCGDSVCLAIQGSTMVDEVVGYACGDSEPELTDISCASVTPNIDVTVKSCGCSGKTNVTVSGTFSFSNLPVLC